MSIQLVNLKEQYSNLKADINEAFEKICSSSMFIKSPVLEKFEKNFAEFIGSKYAVGVGSGTEALHLSLVALDLQKGDEVILPVNTFVATAYAVIYLGAKPVFVDIDPKTYNIDVNLIEKYINKRTKAIIPVHLYGQPADMDKIIHLAKKYRLSVVEDACQSHGAKYKKKNVGCFGVLSAFSFYPGKNLGAYGDGGIITTNSNRLANLLIKLREYGSVSKYKFEMLGFNSRLDTLQAAILDIKLKHLKEWNNSRMLKANYYDKKIKEELPSIITPFIAEDLISVYHLYVIRTKKRNELLKYLAAKGIQTGIHYPIPLHLQKSLKDLHYKKGQFPVAEMVSKEILSLPMYPELTSTDQDFVIESIKSFFNK